MSRVVLLSLLAPLGLCAVAQGCTSSEAALDAAPSGGARAWITAASMSVGRRHHQAVLLPADRVLLTGGLNGAGTILSSVEIYDDLTRTVTSARPMRSARWGHSATLLSDGQVLVVGGISEEGATNEAEVYDPRQGTWTPAPGLRHARSQHGAVSLQGGDLVLVVGGFAGESGEVVQSCEIYHHAQQQWLPAGRLQQGRAAHTTTLLDSGRVLVTGGLADIDTLTSTEIYDPTTTLWTAAADLAVARRGHAAARLTDGRVVVVGGETDAVEMFDPQTGLMIALGDLDIGRSGHSVTAIGAGQALMVGGLSAGGVAGSLFDAVELFDGVTLSWTADSRLNTARHEHQATLLPSGRVLISGGSGPSGPLASLELSLPYDMPLVSDGGPAADGAADGDTDAVDAVDAADAVTDAADAADAGLPSS